MDTRFLKLPGGSIAYDEMGHGPLVICVPGMGDLRSEYRFLAPPIAKAGYRVICMDVRGHGESGTDWDDYSVAGVGSDILALIRSLNAGPAVVIGTSMAAGAGVWAAAHAPGAIAGLVVFGPFVRGEPNWMSKLLNVLFTRPWGARMWLQYYASLYPARKPADFTTYRTALYENLTQPGRLEALQQMLAASKTASEQALPQVTAPTLVLMGSKDPDFKNPELEAQWVAEHLHSSYHMIQDAGHYAHAEMPEVTTPIVLSFIQSLKYTREDADAA